MLIPLVINLGPNKTGLADGAGNTGPGRYRLLSNIGVETRPFAFFPNGSELTIDAIPRGTYTIPVDPATAPALTNPFIVEVDSNDGEGPERIIFRMTKEIPSSALAGEFTLTRTIKSSAVGNPLLPGALVILKDQNGVILDRSYANEVANVSWELNTGDYLVSAWASGHSFLVDQPLEVAGASTGDILLDPVVTAPPGEVGLCSVTDTLLLGDGSPAVGETVTALPNPIPQWNNAGLVGGEKREAVTDALGVFNLQLVQGHSYSMVVPLWGLDHEVVYVPPEENRSLRSLLEDMGLLSSQQEG